MQFKSNSCNSPVEVVCIVMFKSLKFGIEIIAYFFHPLHRCSPPAFASIIDGRNSGRIPERDTERGGTKAENCDDGSTRMLGSR